MADLKKIGATIILVLFCCILQAKEGYKISLLVKSPISINNTPDSLSNSATLSLLRWEKDSIIATAHNNKKGEYRFEGKRALQPGEYLIKCNGKSIELFVSDSDSYLNEKLILQGNEIIQKRGSAENSHFIYFQNLINYQWHTLSSAEQLQQKIDSIGGVLDKENLSVSLLSLMLAGYSAEKDYISRIANDSRILNTRFGKKFIKEYFTDIEYNSNDAVIAALEDILHGANKEVAAAAAIEAFRHFSDPNVMGQESIACYIAEEYFKKGILEAPGSVKFEMNAYVMLNKGSLLGMPAQELAMQDSTGAEISLLDLAQKGRYTIIYFYTDDCITCSIETPKLVSFLNDYTASAVNVYAVYTQNYKERWIKYINDNLQINNPHINWVNIWDPEFESGFHMLYNVISTPQIYVIDNGGTIIGRGLTVNSLKELMEQIDELLNMLKR